MTDSILTAGIDYNLCLIEYLNIYSIIEVPFIDYIHLLSKTLIEMLFKPTL